jgi:hypothetical protein
MSKLLVEVNGVKHRGCGMLILFLRVAVYDA